KPSRPDAETASATGGSRVARGLAVTRWTTATTAFQTASPSVSARPGPGGSDGTASAAWARTAPSALDPAGLTALDPMSMPTRLTGEIVSRRGGARQEGILGARPADGYPTGQPSLR